MTELIVPPPAPRSQVTTIVPVTATAACLRKSVVVPPVAGAPVETVMVIIADPAKAGAVLVNENVTVSAKSPATHALAQNGFAPATSA